MTYRQLLNRLREMETELPCELDNDVSIALMEQGEVFAVMDFVSNPWSYYNCPDHDPKGHGLDIVTGVLDDNHPYLTISA